MARQTAAVLAVLASCLALASAQSPPYPVLSTSSVCSMYAPGLGSVLPKYSGFISNTSTLQFADANCQRVPIQGPNVWGWMELAGGYEQNTGLPAGCNGITYIMSRMAQDSQPVVRVRFHGAASTFAVEPYPGQYNEAALKALDYIVYQAGQYGVKLMAVLADNWQKADSTYNYAMWVSGTNNTDLFFTNPQAIQLYQNHIKAIITRKNTITGVTYANDPAIFAWDLINEPRSILGSACGNCYQTISTWGINQAAFVRTLDTNHLITIGTEGFWGINSPNKVYNPSYNTGSLWSSQTGQDFDTQFLSSNLFASYHYWPDLWGDTSLTFENNWIMQHDMVAQKLGKANVLSEFGKQYDITTGNNDAIRTATRAPTYNQIFQAYLPAYNANSLQGVMFWRFANTPANSGIDSNEIAANDAVYQQIVVPNYATVLKASGTATGCTKAPTTG